jgi:hypothetical protein
VTVGACIGALGECSPGKPDASRVLHPEEFSPLSAITFLSTQFCKQETNEETPIFTQEYKVPGPTFEPRDWEHVSDSVIDITFSPKRPALESLRKRDIKAAIKSSLKVEKNKAVRQAKRVGNLNGPLQNQVAYKKGKQIKKLDCPRCGGSTTPHRCDVGMKSVFRGIRRCAIDEFGSFSAEEVEVSLANRQRDKNLRTLDPELAREMAQLIFAFIKTTTNNDYEQDESLTSREIELCALMHKVCYKLNDSAYDELVTKTAFQTLLKLSQFSSQNILRNIQDH